MGQKRKVAGEEFYTPAATAKRCVDLVDRHLGITSFRLIVEPSAGAGAFLPYLPSHAIAMDVNPRHPKIDRRDYLGWLPIDSDSSTLVIGNPPFGQRGALAMRFIMHSSRFAHAIAMILPRSFEKYTFQNRIPLSFHLIDSFLCEDFETPDGGLVKVRSTFQIWQRRARPRSQQHQRSEHEDFEMIHRHLSRTPQPEIERIRREFPVALPQVGGSFRPRPSASITAGSYWFIKPKHPRVLDLLSKLDFSFNHNKNTAHSSLSKRDIVRAYENVLLELRHDTTTRTNQEAQHSTRYQPPTQTELGL
jgi:hypothetical protein